MQTRLENFLSENNLRLVKKISKGYSSEVFLVKNARGKSFALKIEKEKSPRKNMVQKEATNLALANKKGIGPKLNLFDEENRCVLMEFVNGKPFSEWVFEEPTKKVLRIFLDTLFVQARALDSLGLSHGQLAGKGKNILVCKNLSVIIDFEKASAKRKARNENQVRSLVFENPNSSLAKKVKEIIGEK